MKFTSLKKDHIKKYQSFNIRQKGRKGAEGGSTCRAPPFPSFQLDVGLGDAVDDSRALSFSLMLYHLKDPKTSSCES